MTSVIHPVSIETNFLLIIDRCTNCIDIISLSPSLSVTNPIKVDPNEERKVPESINMEIVDEQMPKFDNGFRSPVSIDQQTENVSPTTNDSQSTLYETDVIKLEEEHATSIIVPDQEISMLDEQFQVAQTKILHLSDLEGQVAPTQNNVPNDSSQNELSPSITTSHENNIDPKNQSPSPGENDQLQSMTTPSACHSNHDLSEQLLVSASEDNFESSQKQLNSDNDENISFEFAPEYMSTKLSEEKKSASTLSFPSDENKDQVN